MNILSRTLLIAFVIVVSACEQKSDTHDHAHSDVENSGNQALYDEVMDIHDEVMPKMNDLYKAKTSMQTRLELPGVSDTEREQIKQTIARIDSASEGMMVWMRQFDPLHDSVGEDKARAYLEKELVKVKAVREDILRALETARSRD